MARMFAAHPETQKLFPRFANVAKSELSTNQDFLQQSYNCLAGLTNIINHLDSPDLMATFLSTMSSPAYFVDGPSASEQLAVRISRLFCCGSLSHFFKICHHTQLAIKRKLLVS